MRVTVLGLGHLGCVSAAWLALRGHEVTGLDDDATTVAGLRAGRPPVAEPGLESALREGRAAGRLDFTTDAAAALDGAGALWVALDMPLGEEGGADAAAVRARLDAIAPCLRPGTRVLVTTPVPVGFTRALARAWEGRGLPVACAPENLQLGDALASLESATPLTVGLADAADREAFDALLAPCGRAADFVGLESAELAKHALNAYLAASVAFVNELARLCDAGGGDADAVERALRRDPRVGPRGYLRAGGPFSGGTLARDVRALVALAEGKSVDAPLLPAILGSNDAHERWLQGRVQALLGDSGERPVAAVLGLSYKPAAGTRARSAAAALCAWLRARGVGVRAHDPAAGGDTIVPAGVTLCDSPRGALRGADLAVVATEWPEYRALSAADFVAAMRRPRVVDAGGFLAGLAGDPRLLYVSPGRRPAGQV